MSDLAWFRPPSDTSPGVLNATFQLLDRRVVAGAADDVALAEEQATPVSVARLLEDVAAIGGVLRAHGVVPGTPVAWRGTTDRNGVTGLLALARVGARLDPDADLLIDDAQVGELDWEQAFKAGRTDPAPAAELATDAPWVGEATVGALARSLRDLVLPLSPAALANALVPTTLQG